MNNKSKVLPITLKGNLKDWVEKKSKELGISQSAYISQLIAKERIKEEVK
ncbi:MAG: hypothetical protein ACRCZK_01630 [Oscillospiraceae bacterium]